MPILLASNMQQTLKRGNDEDVDGAIADTDDN